MRNRENLVLITVPVILVVAVVTAVALWDRHVAHPVDLALVGFECDRSVDWGMLVERIGNIIPWAQETCDDENSCNFASPELGEHSNELLAFVLDLVVSGELSRSQVLAIDRAMREACFYAYRYFLHNLAVSFRKGRVSEETMMRVFLGRGEGWRVVLNNHRDPVVRRAMGIVLRAAGIDRENRWLLFLTWAGFTDSVRKLLIQR